MTGINDYGIRNLEEEPSIDTTFSHIDYNHSNFPLVSPLLGNLFSQSDLIELSTIATTPNGFMPSPNDSLNSPPQLVTDFDDQLLTELASALSDNSYGSSYTSTDPLFNVLGTSVPEIQLNGYELDTLQIIAQPSPTYRPRYECEVDPDKGRANRFIRTSKDNQQYEYPTIRIPSWCNPKQQLYIQVTLVTIISDRIPKHCIHPYNIFTSDNNAFRDTHNNSLYFRINESEYHTGVKNFCIMILKKKQDQLKLSEPMRLFDHEPFESITIENPTDPKRKIKLYQLMKSQFVFTIAQRKEGTNEFLFFNPSVESDIMTEEGDITSNSPRNYLNSESIDEIKCIPQRSNWKGGEEIVIIMPNSIKKKKYTIGFDFGERNIRTVEIELVGTRTILFRAPACPFQAGDENRRVPILIHENQSRFATIDFYYIPPIKTTINKRSLIQEDIHSHINHKRLRDFHEKDNIDTLATGIGQLSISKMDTKPRSNSASLSTSSLNEKLNNLDKRLGQIKLGLENFVRTNDPSELFRAVGFLLSKYDGNSSPLHDAIENGHIEIALTVIKQTMDLHPSKNLLRKENENGETPLLIAAKFNQWKIIELILKTRSDLMQQKDKDGNNLLHFLANLSEDKGAETIENVLRILPQELKINLLKEENKQNQTPTDIAKSNGNISSSKMLHNHENNSE